MEITESKITKNLLIKALGILGSITGIGAFAVSFAPIYGVNSIYIGLIGFVISSIALYLGFKNNNSSSRGIIIIGIITSILGVSFGYYQKRKIDELTNAINEPVEKIKKELYRTVDGVSEDFKDIQNKSTKGIETIKEEGFKKLQEIQSEGAKQLEKAKNKGKEQFKKMHEESSNALKNKLKSYLDDDDKKESTKK